mgnify:CR=1 FL=1
MDKLLHDIQTFRAKYDGLRKRGLKETPTRTIVVDPLLGALGWDVRDPDEVELEYPTVDGKSVDYALKINTKPVLLVEAKPLDDPLDDVKGITQVVGYAANDGIVWCVLTNGFKWKVYRSVEKCAAPEKLMYEVSLDPRDDPGSSIEESARLLWRLSRDEMAKGTLDALGEQIFTDGKVRKALDAVMADPPRPFLKILRSAAGDGVLTPQQIKESIARIWVKGPSSTSANPRTSTREKRVAVQAESPSRTSKASRRRGKSASVYAESHHTSDKPREAVELYRAIDQFCLSLRPGAVERRYLAKYISYVIGKETFCSLHILRGGLRVWLKLKYNRLDSPPAFARDMSGIGHWGIGDLELAINSHSQLEEGLPFVRTSFEACAG